MLSKQVKARIQRNKLKRLDKPWFKLMRAFLITQLPSGQALLSSKHLPGLVGDAIAESLKQRSLEIHHRLNNWVRSDWEAFTRSGDWAYLEYCSQRSKLLVLVDRLRYPRKHIVSTRTDYKAKEYDMLNWVNQVEPTVQPVTVHRRIGLGLLDDVYATGSFDKLAHTEEPPKLSSFRLGNGPLPSVTIKMLSFEELITKLIERHERLYNVTPTREEAIAEINRIGEAGVNQILRNEERNEKDGRPNHWMMMIGGQRVVDPVLAKDFEGDMLNAIGTCKCGETIGNHNIGAPCKSCGTEVKAVPDAVTGRLPGQVPTLIKKEGE